MVDGFNPYLGRVIGAAVVGAAAVIALGATVPFLVSRQMHFALHSLHLRLQLGRQRLPLRLAMRRI